jgi:glyoxylase-like metal-dependent hydrolase (beta-lactamase superfamily II)
VDVVEVLPRLHLLRFPVGNAYLWQDPDGLALVDCGLAGAANGIADAIRELGRQPEELRHLVLTHFHADHVGTAADLVTWGEVTVYAHGADADVIRGASPGPAPVLSEWERELMARTSGLVPDAPPVRVDREVNDGDVLPFAGGAAVVGVPGHTPGSIAVHLPESGVLFTGDTIARAPGGRVLLGVFNVDSAMAKSSARRQAELDVAVACFGHGEPLTEDAASLLRAVAW